MSGDPTADLGDLPPSTRLLIEAGTLLAGPLDERTALCRLAELLVPRLADWCIVDLVATERSSQQGRRPAQSPAAALPLVRLIVVPPDAADPASAGLAQELMALSADHLDGAIAGVPDGVTHFADLSADAPPAADPGEHSAAADAPGPGAGRRSLLLRLGVRSQIVVPLSFHGRTHGLLTLWRAASGRRFLPQDLALAQELGRRAALVLDDGRLHRQAQEAVREREEFLSIAAHELRGPLTPLQLQVQMMLRSARFGHDDALRHERVLPRLESCERHIKRLSRLIQDLLDVSRINAGRLSLDLEEVELSVLVRDTVARFASGAGQQGHPDGPGGPGQPPEIVLSIEDTCTGRWDRGRLEQVLTNLLSNAVRYGRGHPIHVTLQRHRNDKDHDPGHRARLLVADRGIGVHPDALPRIFDRFERAPEAKNYGGGLGLGLYIVRQIMEALGGTVGVVSEPDVGSTFTLELPCLPCRDDAPEPAGLPVTDQLPDHLNDQADRGDAGVDTTTTAFL